MNILHRPSKIINSIFSTFIISFSACFTLHAEITQDIKTTMPSLANSRVEVVSLPALNTESEVDVGQTIISTVRVKTQNIVMVKQDVNISRKAGFFDNKWSFSVNIRKLEPLLPYLDNQDGTFYIVNPNPQTLGTNGGFGIFISNDSTKPSVTWSLEKSVITLGIEPIEVEKSKKEMWEVGSFKRELIYSGISQGNVNISYREFKDDYARPSFNQDLKYDLSQGDVIGFRGARFQILSANNVSLKYKILKAFPDTLADRL